MTATLSTYYQGCAINVWRQPGSAHYGYSLQRGDQCIQGTMIGRSQKAIARRLKESIRTSAWHREHLGLQEKAAAPAPRILQVNAGTIADIYDVWMEDNMRGFRRTAKVTIIELKRQA